MLGPVASLALVLVLLAGLWLLLRRLSPAAGSGRHLMVLESAPLGRGSHLTLVRLGDRCYLLAATAERVSVVGEIDAEQLPQAMETRRDASLPLPKGHLARWLGTRSKTGPA